MPASVPQIPLQSLGYRACDPSISPRTSQPTQQLIATGCYSPRQGTVKCDPKKGGSWCAFPYCVRRVGIKSPRKVSSVTGRGVYATVSAVILKNALRLHSACKGEANRRLTLGYDIVSLLLGICILSSSFSLSLFTVSLLQLNATSVMGIGQGDLVDTQVGVTTFLLSLYVLLGTHYWLMWKKSKGPRGRTRALSAGAAIGITMLRVIHADPFLADFHYLQHAGLPPF